MLNKKNKLTAVVMLGMFTAGTLASCATEEKKTETNTTQSTMTTTPAPDTAKPKIIDTSAVSRPIKPGNQPEATTP